MDCKAWMRLIALAGLVLTWPIFYLIRLVVLFIAKCFNSSDFDEFLGRMDIAFSFDSFNVTPLHTLTTTFKLNGRVDPTTFIQEFHESIINQEYVPDAFKRLRQFPKSFLGYTFWAWDKTFDLPSHIEFLDGRSPTLSESSLPSFLASLAKKPFPLNRSLWKLYVVNNFNSNPGSSCLIFKSHHVVVDVKSLELLVKFASKKRLQPTTDNPNNLKLPPIKPPGFWKKFKANTSALLLILSHPMQCWKLIRPLFTQSWLQQLNQDGTQCRDILFASTCKYQLATFEQIKTQLGVSLCSLFLTGIVRGLDKYLEQSLGPTHVPRELSMSYAMSSPKHPSELINHFTATILKLQLDESKDFNLLDHIKAINQIYRQSTDTIMPKIIPSLLDLFGVYPTTLFKLFLIFPHHDAAFSSIGFLEAKFDWFGHEITEVRINPGPAVHPILEFPLLSYNQSIELTVALEVSLIQNENNLKYFTKLISNELDKMCCEFLPTTSSNKL